MDGAMTGDAHSYRTLDVPVEGGALRVGVWDVPDAAAPTVVLVHGITSSHLAWEFLVEALPGIRLVAPDLRGRGRSNEITGPAGMHAHADDLAAVFAHLSLEPTVVVGHSMGAFVSVVLADRHADLVTRLVLIDGGLPLSPPAGLSPDELVEAILGPTAARLSMRFRDLDDYLAFWRPHPAFAADWSPELERYLAYDLVPAGAEGLRPATSYATTVGDTVDLNVASTVSDALAALRRPALFITTPRGLQDEEPGLYPAARLPEILAAHPTVVHRRWSAYNHYTVVLSAAGAADVAAVVREELSAG